MGRITKKLHSLIDEDIIFQSYLDDSGSSVYIEIIDEHPERYQILGAVELDKEQVAEIAKDLYHFEQLMSD